MGCLPGVTFTSGSARAIMEQVIARVSGTLRPIPCLTIQLRELDALKAELAPGDQFGQGALILQQVRVPDSVGMLRVAIVELRHATSVGGELGEKLHIG